MVLATKTKTKDTVERLMYRVEGKKKMSTNNKAIQFFVPADVVDQFKINLILSKQRSQQVILSKFVDKFIREPKETLKFINN